MRREPGASLIRTACCVFVVSQPLLARAQEQSFAGFPTGADVSFSFSQRFESDSNPQLEDDVNVDETQAITRLGFDIESITRSQSFRFSGGLQVRFETRPEEGEENQTLETLPFRLNYERSNASSSFSLNGSYDNQLIAYVRPLEDFFDSESDLDDLPDDIDDLYGTGRREDRSFSTRISVGNDGPVTASLGGSYSDLQYTDTSNALDDNRRFSVDGEVSARVSSVTDISLSGRYGRLEEEDAINTVTQTRGISVGVDHSLNKIITASLSIGHSERVEDIDGVSTTTRSGLEGSAGLDFDRPNGAFGVEASFAPDEDGETLYNAGVNRSFETRRGDEFGGSLGVAMRSGGENDPALTAGLNYGTQTRNTVYSANVNRGIRINDDGEDELRSVALLSINHAMSPLSSIGSSLSYVETNNLETGFDETLAGITAQYNRSLTRDWDVEFGFGYNWRENTSSDWIDNQSVFVGIGRSFDY